MNEPVKDPLGVVAKWKAEESPHQFTGWDEVKYPLAVAGLVLALVGSVALLFFGLFL